VQGAWRGVTVAAVLLLAGFATGCDKVTGGGWIVSSADPTEKATFGFTAKCETRTINSTPTAVLYDGQLEYEDQAADVRIHGDVEPSDIPGFQFVGMTCQQLRDIQPFPLGAATFEGKYRSQPSGGEGTFMVIVLDGGEPGVGSDALCITLTGAITYANCGAVAEGTVLEGGNIEVH
jgi:hypothetical protein